MTMIDRNTDTIYTLSALKREYETFKKSDPLNHAETFKRELSVIIMDTINGRNDFSIINMTSDDISNMLNRLN